jgi:hypothetical protein
MLDVFCLDKSLTHASAGDKTKYASENLNRYEEAKVRWQEQSSEDDTKNELYDTAAKAARQNPQGVVPD